MKFCKDVDVYCYFPNPLNPDRVSFITDVFSEKANRKLDWSIDIRSRVEIKNTHGTDENEYFLVIKVNNPYIKFETEEEEINLYKEIASIIKSKLEVKVN